MPISDYLENKLIDFLLRAQSFTAPTTVYIALFTVAPTGSGGGTEVSGGNYSRVSVSSSLVNWAGTQGAGTTTASSGTTGLTSNNNEITFLTPNADWGNIIAFGIFDSPTGGNLLLYGTLVAPRPVYSGDPPPSFDISALTISFGT